VKGLSIGISRTLHLTFKAFVSDSVSTSARLLSYSYQEGVVSDVVFSVHLSADGVHDRYHQRGVLRPPGENRACRSIARSCGDEACLNLPMPSVNFLLGFKIFIM